MIKPLLITSLCATVGAVGFFGLAAISAAAHGGPTGPFSFMSQELPGGGATTVRDLTWTGDERLGVSIPANIRYVQGPVASLRITGPKGMVDQVVVNNGRLEFARRVNREGRIEVAMTAPNVTQFHLAGSQKLDIAGYDQPELETHIAGSGDIVAHGAAARVEVHVAGSGDVDLSGVVSQDAVVHIAGSGDVTVTPSQSAQVHIAGSGDVTVKSATARVERHVAGSGKIIQETM